MAIVFIEQISTGEVISHLNENYNEYMWREGNYSCDCNRELFFYRAKGIDKWDKVKCSEGRYRVWVSDNGKNVYDEIEFQEA